MCSHGPRSASIRHHLTIGWALALVSAAAFGTSGVLGKGLLAAGWSPAAAVAARVALGAVVLALPAVWQLRGRWGSLRRGWPSVLLFGLLGVAGCQLAYFMAIQRMPVAMALLIGYLGVILVVAWLWLRHGQRPRPLTRLGALLSVVGLAFVLDVFGAFSVDLVGVLWALSAAIGLAGYFILAADQSHGLPPLALASGGLAAGGALLLLLGAIGLLPLQWSAADVELAGALLPWWAGVLALGLLAAALSYATGVMASRRLGSKMASFLGLSEMLFVVWWAWLLLGEVPTLLQGLGGALIFAGVVVIKLDE